MCLLVDKCEDDLEHPSIKNNANAGEGDASRIHTVMPRMEFIPALLAALVHNGEMHIRYSREICRNKIANPDEHSQACKALKPVTNRRKHPRKRPPMQQSILLRQETGQQFRKTEPCQRG
ncbi:MAG: hypothetical protein LBH04_05105 [Tannerellaceae bacterium]|jgi:hypothetical protein|nr:hypothetical protein [Tannerellaceae bacterium]